MRCVCVHASLVRNRTLSLVVRVSCGESPPAMVRCGTGGWDALCYARPKRRAKQPGKPPYIFVFRSLVVCSKWSVCAWWPWFLSLAMYVSRKLFLSWPRTWSIPPWEATSASCGWLPHLLPCAGSIRRGIVVCVCLLLRHARALHRHAGRPSCVLPKATATLTPLPPPPLLLLSPPPAFLFPSRALQGAGAVLPGLHESGTPTREGAPPLEDAAGLSEVYRDGDAGDGGDGSGGGVAGSSRIVPTSRVSGRGAGGGEEREEWETADDRIEASLRGCISLTSLDVSSPRVPAGFIKRCEGLHLMPYFTLPLSMSPLGQQIALPAW